MMTPEDLLAEVTAAALPPSRPSRSASRSHRQAPRVGAAKGGRPELDRLGLAEGFADQNRDASGVLLLRWWRSGWWRFGKGAWFSVPSADIEAELSGFIARQSGQCGELLRRDVLAGLQGVNLCGLSGVEMPCFLSSSGAAAESAEGWLAAGTTLIHPKRLAAGLPDAVRPASPLFFSSVCLPYSFDPAAACPLWEEALAQWHPDAETRRHLQMMAGLAVTGDKSHNVFFVLPGPPGAGKSTFADVLEAMIGRANVCGFSLSSLVDKSSLGALTRSALAVCRDSEGERDRGDLAAAEGFLKLATGGEEVQVRELHRNGYSSKCRALVVMFANDLPAFKDRTGALGKRMRIIPFLRVFRDTAGEVRDLSARIIAEELPGVLNWALEGARMADAERRFPELAAGRAEKEKHFRESDSARLFIAEVLEACAAGLPGLGIESKELYAKYRAFAQEGGYHAVNLGNFVKAVELAFPEAMRREERGGGKRATVWRGIRWRDGDDETEGF